MLHFGGPRVTRSNSRGRAGGRAPRLPALSHLVILAGLDGGFLTSQRLPKRATVTGETFGPGTSREEVCAMAIEKPTKRTIDPVPFKALMKRWDGKRVVSRLPKDKIPFTPADEIKPKQS